MSGIPAGAGSLIGKRLGKYEVVALLALGGTAEIYLARIDGTAGFEKYVVVKCLHDHLADDPDFVKMFLDEARLSSALDHSNIVQTFELGEHENRYYIAMEFLAGLSLAMIVRRAAERVPGGRLPIPLVLNITAQTTAGLHYAHERTAGGAPQNLVHRDISPQNLVIGFEGVVKVVDFGIARAELRETKTKAGTIKGKFAYMSPEQCVATNVDRRTDVFALGVIVYELLTGRRLFKRNSPYETYQAVIECNVPAPSTLVPEIDPALDEIVLRAVARDKDQRWQSAEAFGYAVQSYMHSRGISSGPAELSRFFDQYFQTEIDEHGDRMRELLAGREFSVDTGVTWGEDKADESSGRASDAQLDHLVSRLQTESDSNAGLAEGDDAPPPEKTRIEANPLELIKELERNGGRAPTNAGPPARAPTNPPQKFPEVQQPTLIADTRSTRARSATKPDLSALPTMAAIPLDPARTRETLDEPLPVTSPELPRPNLPPRATSVPIGPSSATHAAVDPEQLMQAMQAQAQAQPQQPPQQQPMQSMQLGPNGAEHVQPPGQSMPMQAIHTPPPMQAMPSGGILIDSYPVVQGGRPFSADLAPSAPLPHGHRPAVSRTMTPPGSPPQQMPGVPINTPSGIQLLGPQQADGYGGDAEWHEAAGKRRALAPWQLIALFGGVLGLALLITLIVAKIAHHRG